MPPIPRPNQETARHLRAEENAPSTADQRALLVSGTLPPADDPEVVWRAAVLEGIFPDSGPILEEHLRVRPFTLRPMPTEKIETDPKIPPRPRTMDKGEYETLRAKLTREWEEKKAADLAHRKQHEIWQCISCGLDLPFGHFRCKYCLAAYYVVEIERRNPHLFPGDQGAVTPEPAGAIPESDPEEDR